MPRSGQFSNSNLSPLCHASHQQRTLSKTHRVSIMRRFRVRTRQRKMQPTWLLKQINTCTRRRITLSKVQTPTQPLFRTKGAQCHQERTPQLTNQRHPQIPHSLQLSRNQSSTFMQKITQLRRFLMQIHQNTNTRDQVRINNTTRPLIQVEQLQPRITPPKVPPTFQYSFQNNNTSRL